MTALTLADVVVTSDKAIWIEQRGESRVCIHSALREIELSAVVTGTLTILLNHKAHRLADVPTLLPPGRFLQVVTVLLQQDILRRVPQDLLPPAGPAQVTTAITETPRSINRSR